MALKQNEFLVIPLAAEYHTGAFGIDYGLGVETWEELFGEQLEHLIWVAERIMEEHGYSIWEMAGLPDPAGEKQ